jgi:1,4-alpha-glucan branching enzyme
VPHGYLSLILHAHLPFVRHPEHEQFLEEDWLYEAITETYIPLLQVLDGLVRDNVGFRLTMSLTPPLCSMLRDPLLQERYVRHITRLIELTGREIERTKWEPAFHELAWFYHLRFRQARDIFCDRYGRDLVGGFRRFQELGRLEIITCAATHGFLPLMREQPQAIRAQILLARDHYRECFGCDPLGIWLPECAYVPGLEDFLQEAELRWFVLDSHGLLFAQPRPQYGIYAPVYTTAGVAAFGRDVESSRQVWSAEEGYPGDPDYRDFYRDIGFDLEFEYIRPFIHPDGIRCFTGVKYHRITDRTCPPPHKQPYARARAVEKAAEHAGHFMFNRCKQIEHLRGVMQREPLVVAPYDAELFGHWWFEGPEFLDFLIRKIAFDQQSFQLITPSDYLRRHPVQQLAQPAPSSWGNKGHWEVWLDSVNAWIYPHLHAAAERMTELARRHARCDGVAARAVRQAARELLLAQSSDWAFIMKTGSMASYAEKRTREHLLRFNRLYEQITAGAVDERWLASIEWRDNIFPSPDPQYFA